MANNLELHVELNRASEELERRQSEIPARQVIRARFAEWQAKDALQKQELKQIQRDCSHSELRRVGRYRMVVDSYDGHMFSIENTCPDCGFKY